ncbi:MAG: endo-1,4-beta-xylanase [Prevotellaceae bacterium]|nr:endo-1,4-beta-xylanase [Prevotellaceae bacterium]
MKYINKLAVCAFSLACVACIDEYDVTIDTPEKPTDVATQEYLNYFDVLKSYIVREAGSPFILATTMAPGDFEAKKLAYSTMINNFEGIDVNGAYTPADMIDSGGDYDFSDVKTLGQAAADDGVTVYGGALCSNQGQPATYLNGLIADEVIPFVSETGQTILIDFEDDEIGKYYASVQYLDQPDLLGDKVEYDPTESGSRGKVLHISEAEGYTAEYHLPVFDVKLPDGKTLGDMKDFIFDSYYISDGWNAAFRLYILPEGWTDRNQYRSEFSDGLSSMESSERWTQISYSIENESWHTALKDLTEFQIAIGVCQGSNIDFYIDNIGFTWQTVADGATTIDFEDDAIGTEYPMTNGSQAVVVADPAGKSGNVLQIGTANDMAVYSYPEFHVTLDDGMTLGDYSSISVDMYFIDGNGIYGVGVTLSINGTSFTGSQPATYGCSSNAWGRGVVNIPLLSDGSTADGSFSLSSDLAALNEFDFTIGSGSGAWYGYIDNISFNWERKGDTVIEKTDEEKEEILTEQLDKWITGMVEAGGENITMWDVVSEPLDNTVDANTFNWGEYLGEKAYARKAVSMARAASEQPLTLFVGNTFYQGINVSGNADNLINLVKEWEDKTEDPDNETVIDGYNIRLNAWYSEKESTQAGYEQEITELFTKLAATGRPVRVSELSVMVADETGNFVSADDALTAQRERAASYVTFIMQEYRRLISPENQYGISISSMTQVEGGSVLCPWTSGYGRTEIYEGIVNGLSDESE